MEQDEDTLWRTIEQVNLHWKTLPIEFKCDFHRHTVRPHILAQHAARVILINSYNRSLELECELAEDAAAEVNMPQQPLIDYLKHTRDTRMTKEHFYKAATAPQPVRETAILRNPVNPDDISVIPEMEYPSLPLQARQSLVDNATLTEVKMAVESFKTSIPSTPGAIKKWTLDTHNILVSAVKHFDRHSPEHKIDWEWLRLTHTSLRAWTESELKQRWCFLIWKDRATHLDNHNHIP